MNSRYQLLGCCALLAAVTATPVVAAEGKYKPHAEVLKDAKPVEGLIKLYRNETKLFAEIPSSQLNKDYLVLISIARGIGQGQLLGGMTWGFGDDWLWQFRKVDDNIHIVRRNTRFTADKGSPEADAVKLAYTDSVLFSLPIQTMGPGGGYVIDLSSVFMSDLPQISRALPGFSFSSSKSSWAAVKGFGDNVELEVAATYASSGSQRLETVPDSRGVTINVHYSISKLPSNGYKPRVADDRVGYFLTVVKDFSINDGQERFVRYINRWDLQKAVPGAELSPPKKPIVFWIEKTVPFEYRKAISDGILEWNKAFEKAGFVNAIEVRQQPDNADWDPEDVNYNTFRWITAGAGFAMGPSRVHPETGQILDADIIFDADFVNFWKHQYETFTPTTIAELTGGALDLDAYNKQMEEIPAHLHHDALCRCNLATGMARQLAFGSAALTTRYGMAPSKPMQEQMIQQGLKEVTMHEVGHTLGLRHNFKASTMLTLTEMQDRGKTGEVGMSGSVMDYLPVNIVPNGQTQGDYYSQTLGPYDTWAIEYGYKPLSNSTKGDKDELAKIGARAPKHDYATDEDTRGIDPDPLTNRFDLGKDPLEYATRQAKLVSELWPELIEKSTADGEGYQNSRRAFGILLGTYGQAMHFASRYVGGLYMHRDHKGDPDGRAPFVVVEAARQRAAVKLLEEGMFSDKPFNFPPELYNHLASSRWSHWGMFSSSRVDYPVHDVISMWQERVLSQLLSSLTLERLHDSELKVPADQDAFTTAELLERLTRAVYSEADKLPAGEYTNRKPAISSIRRNLQRSYLRSLGNLALGNTSAPDDCQTVAYMELVTLQGKLKQQLADKELKLDSYSRAHLHETNERIGKILDARLYISRP